MALPTARQTEPARDAVLAKAVLRAAEQLGLSQSELARVLGTHRTAVSRLKNKQRLDPASKQGELALLLIRMARALSAFTGGDAAWTTHFMRNHNRVTHGVPAEQIGTIEGLVRVLQFVDAARGKV